MASRYCIAYALTAALLAVASPVVAQSADPPPDAPVNLGPLVLAPSIRLTNLGRDTNVLNRDQQDNPRGDFVVTLSPSIDGWLRMAHGRAYGRTRVDAYYFKQFVDLRAVDSDSSAYMEVPLNRFKPYVNASLVNTRHRYHLEIDSITRRRSEIITVGTDVRLTGRLSVSAFGRRSGLTYDPRAEFLNTNLARSLNHNGTGGGATIRYALTPFTSLGIEGVVERDRFRFAPERDGQSVLVTPTLEFSPRALISGRVSFGFARRRVRTGSVPEYRGSTALVDLTYTLLGRTQFTLLFRRRLDYSFDRSRTDYLENTISVAAVHRMGDAWDLQASIGRSTLLYQPSGQPDSPLTTGRSAAPFWTWGADLGRSLGRTRIGFQLEQVSRDAADGGPLRGYRRYRYGSTATYRF